MTPVSEQTENSLYIHIRPKGELTLKYSLDRRLWHTFNRIEFPLAVNKL